MDNLHVVVVDPDKERADIILSGLEMDLSARVTLLSDTVGLARKLQELSPDIVLIDFENPGRDVLTAVTSASTPSERPVAMFTENPDRDMMNEALEAGVSAYIVHGLQRERMRPIIEMAITRFHAFAKLNAELQATKTALSERKTIDRAKGLLMKARGIDEGEAYSLLRKAAMDQGKRVSEIAENIITAAQLLS